MFPIQTYRAWIAQISRAEVRFMRRYFQFLLDQKSFGEAEKLIARYQTTLPDG